MQTINLDDMDAQLSSLIERAATGEEVVFARDGQPVARLVPLTVRSKPVTLGLLAGQVWIGPDFDDPLPPDIQAAFDGHMP